MSIQKIKTYTNVWLSSYEITIEADLNNSVPNIEIIWLPDASIKEAKERIRSTFRNCWISLPNKRIILNLAPSDTKKIWTSFDLPMAVAILVLIFDWVVNDYDILDQFLFFWELWLDWEIKRVNWLLTSVISSINKWYKYFFVPKENIHELEYIPNIIIFPVWNFQEIIDYFIYNKPIKVIDESKDIEQLFISQNKKYNIDFQDIKWHLIAKRASCIAAAWFHNILYIWAPWSWKTMLSKTLMTIMPPLDFWEILEISKIYSIVWKLNKDNPLIVKRPFRQVHHTASKISIVWWWRFLTPWEVSLAHKWVLFFDELAEFPREVLEVLRQPLEDKNITISRVSWTVKYPAEFMFVSSMNPCKCGFFQDNEKQCKCNINEVKRYQSKISWPLLDRIDMIIDVYKENFDKIMSSEKWESSEELRKKVKKAREIQKERYKNTNIKNNANIPANKLDNFIPLWEEEKNFLKTASENLQLSTRVLHRTLKLSRTIADLEWVEKITIEHLSEAIQYRSKNFFIDW